MKIIITESQFEQIIPNSVRRRLSEISDVLYAMSKRTLSEKFKVAPDEYVKLFKNNNFELVVPLTFEASKKYGANAKWCTTTKCDDTMFNKHNKMGSLAYLIVKNPEIAQRLGNTKYGLFINKPDDNYLGGKYAAPSGIMMYGDNNSILSQSQVENEFDKLDLLTDYYKIMRSFLDYSQDKFSKESVNEDITTALRRRLNFDEFITYIDFIIEHEITPCGFEDPQDFIETVCDYMKDSVSENFSYDLTPKEKDELYYFFVAQFSSKIKKEYDKTLKNRANESVKKIIVTESQYNRLFETKLSKIEVFQDLINNKLDYIRGFCNEDLSAENYGGDVGFGSCDDIAVIDSVKVDEVNMMTGARTDMSGKPYDSTPSIHIKLTIEYTDIGTHSSFDDIVYDLRYGLRKSTGGLPIVFSYTTKNLKTNKEW